MSGERPDECNNLTVQYTLQGSVSRRWGSGAAYYEAESNIEDFMEIAHTGDTREKSYHNFCGFVKKF